MPGEKQEAIGKEELEAVAACVKHGSGLLKVLKQTYKVDTLPQLLSMEDAAFRTAGSTKEDKAVAAIAKQMRSTGNASLQAMLEPAIRVLLYELTESARVRNPDCVRRQQLAAGLKGVRRRRRWRATRTPYGRLWPRSAEVASCRMRSAGAPSWCALWGRASRTRMAAACPM
jgi:hypothetical protein